ncbi:MAG: NADH-quinone oxidoreductase subunit F [Gammaproteobacteria bacterium]|nr:NADH-quinone oxidoreductase subunit F [Gammaproteobacteria bacterium]MYD75953.1 NADH-quinone oxidoreductase subunit F [Gammaproteobacteria bacterium]MYJ52811.1 NADH-quinone oxidoreductase subunit F [Gammaproteobacteria bacterium]
MQGITKGVRGVARREDGSRHTSPHPKGRQVNPEAQKQVRGLIGDSPRRDLLIEYLHRIQDRYGYLSSDHLAGLADEMSLAQSEVYEVATFYAHFDVVREGEQPPPPLTIRVCDSISCELANAETLIGQLERASMEGVRVLRAPCMGRCESAPVAEVGHNHVIHATFENICEAVDNGHVHPPMPDYIDFDAYRASGGYQLWQACMDGERTPESILEDLDESQLKGLGGAGFPAGRKWRIVRGYDAPRLMAVNIDEGEPGTFKDRYYLETDPHRSIEGMLIAAWVVGTEKAYVYVRDEYPAIVSLLKSEIAKVQAAGLADHVEIEVRRGAGAYICGEESAMIESIEGKRGLPRNRPPYVAEVGLFGRPTLENNIETLHWVRDIVEKGPRWFAQAGTNGRFGLRSYSVSGRVKDPGVKLAPAGITIRELIDDYCGGMQEGHAFKGYLPGGASGGILPASLDDVPLDFGTLQEYGCFIGSAAVVVFSDRDNMKDVALNLMRFFRDESCGQCTPCRAGTEKAVKVMMQPEWDRELLEDLSIVMTDASICGLGQAAGNPINCVLKYFPEDL